MDEDYGEFLGEPNSSEEAEQPPVTVVASSSVGVTCIILCGKLKEAATGYKSRVHRILLCTDIAHEKKITGLSQIWILTLSLRNLTSVISA